MLIRNKTVAPFLILILYLPVLLQAGYTIARKINYLVIEERMENSLLQTISVSPQNLTWIERGTEAVIDGRLFDVKSFKENRQEIVLTGLFDTTEDKINEQLSRLEQNQNHSSPPVYMLLVKLFTPAIPVNASFKTDGSFEAIQKEFLAYCDNPYFDPSLTVSTQPPNT